MDIYFLNCDKKSWNLDKVALCYFSMDYCFVGIFLILKFNLTVFLHQFSGTNFVYRNTGHFL